MKSLGVRKILRILLGNFIYAFAVTYFVVPLGLLMGGFTGLAMFINRFTGWSVSLLVTISLLIIFVIGYLAFGKEFALKTALSTFSYPLLLMLTEVLFHLTGPLTDDIMLATIYAAVGIGGGTAIILAAGASGGGMDVLALLLQRRTGLSVSLLMNVLDCIAIVLLLTVSTKEEVLYGLLLVVLYTLLMNEMMLTGKKQMQIQIISQKHDEITAMIQEQFHRGVTLVEIAGGYTHESGREVLTIVSPRQVMRLQEAVNEIDPTAFIIIEEVREVQGRGFGK